MSDTRRILRAPVCVVSMKSFFCCSSHRASRGVTGGRKTNAALPSLPSISDWRARSGWAPTGYARDTCGCRRKRQPASEIDGGRMGKTAGIVSSRDQGLTRPHITTKNSLCRAVHGAGAQREPPMSERRRARFIVSSPWGKLPIVHSERPWLGGLCPFPAALFCRSRTDCLPQSQPPFRTGLRQWHQQSC